MAIKMLGVQALARRASEQARAIEQLRARTHDKPRGWLRSNGASTLGLVVAHPKLIRLFRSTLCVFGLSMHHIATRRGV